jgi:creatinine amidohydrolase
MELEWARLKASELRALAAQDAIVVVPVAAMEQHGPHLPVMVDSLLCAEVALRTARRVAARQPVVVAPTVWSGLSEHHMAFGGTFTLDFPTFFALLRCLCRSLVTHGFRRIFLLNGHGGNRWALRVVVDELSGELDAGLATATYWEPAAGLFARILERQPGVQHACEAETSMVLALRPELVEAARFAEAKFSEAPHAVTQRGAHLWRSFAARTPTGVIGDPTAASAEKGERLLDAAAETMAELLLDDGCWIGRAPAPT